MFSIAAIVWALLLASPLAQGGGRQHELRYSLKQDLLTLINRDRARNGLTPVELDPQTSQLADLYCDQQLRYGTTGHFTIDGLAPYMRYSFSGGNDGVSENAAAWSANYSFADSSIPELIRRSQAAMLAEVPPNDGHRKTLLDPHATHVGLGISWEKGEFRMVQEFIRRYIEWTGPLPRAASTGQKISSAGRPRQGYEVEAISVYHEPFPQAMTAVVANRISSYGLPGHRRDYLPRYRPLRTRSVGGARLARNRESRSDGFVLHRDGTFSFTVPTREGSGIYTVVVWVRKKGERTAIAASNISIRVDDRTPTFPLTHLGGR